MAAGGWAQAEGVVGADVSEMACRRLIFMLN